VFAFLKANVKVKYNYLLITNGPISHRFYSRGRYWGMSCGSK